MFFKPLQYVDKWYKSKDEPTFLMARRLIREEGLLCGWNVLVYLLPSHDNNCWFDCHRNDPPKREI